MNLTQKTLRKMGAAFAHSTIQPKAQAKVSLVHAFMKNTVDFMRSFRWKRKTNTEYYIKRREW